MSFKQINLPLNVPHKQELLDPWRMLVSPIWCGHSACPPLVATSSEVVGGVGGLQPPPPAGEHPVRLHSPFADCFLSLDYPYTNTQTTQPVESYSLQALLTEL